MIDYCRTSMAFEGRESFRILFFDKKNGLIADEVQGSGTVDHTPVYPREVMRPGAGAIGDGDRACSQPLPRAIRRHRRKDIKMTLDIIAVAKSLRPSSFKDHIIVGRDGHASPKAGMRLI